MKRNNIFKNDKGASITLALFLVLLCTLICAVIVTASFGNVSRAEKQKTSYQSQLSLISAAKLFSEGISDLSFNVVDYDTVGAVPGIYTDGYEFVIDGEIKDAVKNKLEAYLANVIFDGNTSTADMQFTIKASGLNDIIVKGYLDENKNLIFIFTEYGKNSGGIKLKYTVSKEVRDEGSEGQTPVGSEILIYRVDKAITEYKWFCPPSIKEVESYD